MKLSLKIDHITDTKVSRESQCFCYFITSLWNKTRSYQQEKQLKLTVENWASERNEKKNIEFLDSDTKESTILEKP